MHLKHIESQKEKKSMKKECMCVCVFYFIHSRFPYLNLQTFCTSLWWPSLSPWRAPPSDSMAPSLGRSLSDLHSSTPSHRHQLFHYIALLPLPLLLLLLGGVCALKEQKKVSEKQTNNIRSDRWHINILIYALKKKGVYLASSFSAVTHHLGKSM